MHDDLSCLTVSQLAQAIRERLQLVCDRFNKKMWSHYKEVFP